MEQFINKLKEQLQKSLPGQDAQYIMAPGNRQKIDIAALSPEQYRSSAVMILFCRNEENGWFLPLTQRFSYPGAHSGQVSLPGGKYDVNDLNLKNTALRECYEEIGIKDKVEVLGALTRLYIPVSTFLIEPYVGVCSTINPLFIPSEREVKAIIRLKIADLMDTATMKEGVVMATGDLEINAPYFSGEDYQIWGATAMILSELKVLLAPIF